MKVAINKMAFSYDYHGLDMLDRFRGISEFNRDQIRLISEGLKPCKKVLDLGVGLGNLAIALVEQGKTVYGVDNSKVSLDYVRRKVGDSGEGRLHLIFKDVSELDYSEKFDGVSCVSNLMFFGNLDKVFSRAYNALRPKGYFAITGMEKAQLGMIFELEAEEIKKYIGDGRLTFSSYDIEKVRKTMGSFEKMLEASDDSSEKTIEGLQKNGFDVLDRSMLYHNTSYYVLAQKK